MTPPRPNLTIGRRWNGYWYVERPTDEELRQELRVIRCAVRFDGAAPPPGSRTIPSRILPARLLEVGVGLIGDVLAGPTIERYGSARPWPWNRYA
jgi:hypothetical protein